MSKNPQGMTIPPTPPRAEGLDIGALSRVFAKTTNSYKFLWMLGLLDVLGEKQFREDQVSARHVVIRMLKRAEDPIRRFHLSLGSQDQMNRHIAQSLGALNSATGITQLVRSENVLDSVYGELSRFVPQRFLTSFFQSDLKGLTDYAKDDAIRRLANQRFSESPLPFYRLSGGRLEGNGGNPLTVIFHARWLKYLKENATIVRGWALWNWVEYLESRNSNVPGIIAKIARPELRKSTGKQREFWREIVGKLGGIHCIYSRERLQSEADYDLDHFVPWSFAGHNNLWNLVPVLKDANIRKSDTLPDKKYFREFVGAQYQALEIYHQHYSGQWKTLMHPYSADLRVDPNDQWSFQQLVEKYELVVPPLLSLAESMGFKSGWDYDDSRPNPIIMNFASTSLRRPLIKG